MEKKYIFPGSQIMGRGQEYLVPRYKGIGSKPDSKAMQLRSDQNLAKKVQIGKTDKPIIYSPKENGLCGEGIYAGIMFEKALADSMKSCSGTYCLLPTKGFLRYVGRQLNGSLKELKEWGFQEPPPVDYGSKHLLQI